MEHLTIELKNLGKRFNRQWIFRRLDYTFTSGNAYAITGYNGSGKSTLLQIIAGAMEKSEGELEYNKPDGLLNPEYFFRSVAFSAPYLELIEELTLSEFLTFHFSLKPMLKGYAILEIMERVDLKSSSNKQIRQFSSGMKQRVKLAQAFYSDVPVLLLDEPTANLDAQGIDLYHSLVQELGAGRLLIICSNDEQEISFCRSRLDITHYKHL